MFPPQLPERHRAGRCHIQGVHAAGHGNPDRIVAVSDRRECQAVTFCSQNDGQLLFCQKLRVVNTVSTIFENVPKKVKD